MNCLVQSLAYKREPLCSKSKGYFQTSQDSWCALLYKESAWPLGATWSWPGLHGFLGSCWCKLKNAACHLFYKDDIISHSNCWHSTHPERCSGWRSGIRHSILWENLVEQTFIVRYFQEKIFWIYFLYPFIPRKSLKSLAEISAPCD